MKSLVIAGVALATGLVFADASNGILYQDDFSGTKVGEATWTGATTSDNVQKVADEATCTPTTVAGLVCRVAEMRVYVAEAGEQPSPLTDTTAQLAIATGPATSAGKISLWVCGSDGWKDSGYAAEKGWVKIRMVFTYLNGSGTCDVTFGDNEKTLTLTNMQKADATTVKSLAFVGETQVDDIKLADLEKAFAAGSPAAGLTVAYDTLVEWEVDATSVTDDQAKKLVAGLNPNDAATVFKATSLKTDEKTKETVVSVPCLADFGQSYKVKVTKADGTVIDTVAATAGAIANESRTLTFTLPETTEKVLKFQILATTTK